MEKEPTCVHTGLLIVFEGIDRAGKSTQSKKLFDTFIKRGIPCVYKAFPDRTTPIGKVINSYLKGKEPIDDVAMHLLFSANRWECYKEICSLLEQGTTVILDRYAYSGVAYTAAKGYPIHWCKEADKGLLKPNIVFYMDVSTEIADKRTTETGDEREIYEQKAFQINVARAFTELKEQGWVLMDATQSQRKIAETICQIVISTLTDSAPFQREHLWI